MISGQIWYWEFYMFSRLLTTYKKWYVINLLFFFNAINLMPVKNTIPVPLKIKPPA